MPRAAKTLNIIQCGGNFRYRDSWVNDAMDNGSNCLLVQNVAGTERIGLSHSKVAWLMVQEILDNGSILFLFSTSKLYIFSH